MNTAIDKKTAELARQALASFNSLPEEKRHEVAREVSRGFYEELSPRQNLTAKTQRAVALYGAALCVEAYRQNNVIGEGANTISHTVLGGKWAGKTRCADAAINAGRELSRASVSAS